MTYADQHTASKMLQSLSKETMERLGTASIIGHSGEVGRAREQILRDHLVRMLPTGLGITTGFVIDALGAVSKQIDIIIHFTDHCPTFVVGGVPLVPVETVIAVLEIKSDLKDKKVLHECYDNIRSVKVLDRSNNETNVDLTEGTPFPVPQPLWSQFDYIIFGAVIAVRGITPKTFVKETSAWLRRDAEMMHWTNAVCVTQADNPTAAYIGAYRDEELNVYTANPTWANGATAFATSPEHPLAWITAEILNFIRIARRISYSPSTYLWAGAPEHNSLIDQHPLPPRSKRLTQIPELRALQLRSSRNSFAPPHRPS